MLHDDLKKLNKYPFHMPGHKRNFDFGIDGSGIDITEINGFDNLHSPHGSILEIEQKLSALYGSEKSFMLINGSTVGLLASIFAVTEQKDKIIISRNCHKSVYNACFLRELDVVYIEPEFNEENGFYTEMKQSAIDKALMDNPDAKAVVVTSPTYEGYISNIHSDIPLIIDAAHGAHFGFGKFPEYPKGDIVVSSLHKTLPSLTQTAVLNVYNNVFTQKIKKYLDIFQTTSPSYVLMNSVSKCIAFLEHSVDAFNKYDALLDSFYETKLNNLEMITTDDRSKIVVSTAKSNINGHQLADRLRENYSIECEMESVNYIILMSSVADTKEAFSALSNALIEIDKTLKICKKNIIKKPNLPMKICNSFEVKTAEKMLLKNASGKISAEYVYAYPPDIPILVPGEEITEELLSNIAGMLENKINVISDSNLLPSYILTKAD
ncbi:MAG: aminotransferase class I/II-fold pyridoxal phosphate-dependent enzyme [Eubacterium sp.]|nr:aminotransferase class I/II-fold pyridoxal phosphate-dependent enzyme [Eubacterium sp.]